MGGHCAVAMATVGTILAPVVALGGAHLPTSSAGAPESRGRCYGARKPKFRGRFLSLLWGWCAPLPWQRIGHRAGCWAPEFPGRERKHVPSTGRENCRVESGYCSCYGNGRPKIGARRTVWFDVDAGPRLFVWTGAR